MTELAWRELVTLAGCWLGYFGLHSVLASLLVKRRVAEMAPNFMPYYRLIFNGLALVFLLPIAWLSYHASASMVWRWQGAAAWLANGLALAALLGFWLSLKGYDMQEFLGLRQLQLNVCKIEDQEHFQLSVFHRFVRHPWYCFGLVLIWTRDMSVSTLLSSVLLTVYLMVGSRLEEQKLLAYHGDTYRRYRQRVPSLLPLPWKYLTAKEATTLLKKTNKIK